VVVPEVDTNVYKIMAEGAGVKPEAAALTKSNIYAAVLAASQALDDAEVPEADRVLTVTPATYALLKQAVEFDHTEIGAEMRAYCRGEYGKTPAPIDPEVRAKILGDEKPIEGRYAETLPADTFEKAQAELGDTARCEEDVLSYIAFPQVAENFFEKRKEAEEHSVRYSIEQI